MLIHKGKQLNMDSQLMSLKPLVAHIVSHINLPKEIISSPPLSNIGSLRDSFFLASLGPFKSVWAFNAPNTWSQWKLLKKPTSYPK